MESLSVSVLMMNILQKITLAILFCIAAEASANAAAVEKDATAIMANHSTAATKDPRRSEAHGILIERVSLSASGIMVDVRYRILDLEKAQKVLNRRTKLQMIDQKTGVFLTVPDMPKVGKLRQMPKSDEPSRIYWMFFKNTGGVAKHGSKLTLSLGDVNLKDLVVE